MALRLALGGLYHETSNYADSCTGISGPEVFEVYRGEEIIEKYRDTRTYQGGMIDGAAAIGAEIVPTFHGTASPSGTISGPWYKQMKGELLESIRRSMPVDAVALELHGAGSAEGVFDLEGDLCSAIRDLVGPDVPIVGPLDLHGNFTEAMAEAADALFGVHKYPHTDMWERGHEAVSALPAIASGELSPVTHVEHLPILLPTSNTNPGGMAEKVNELCAQMEARPGMIDCTFFHGFLCTDNPHVGVHIVAIADRDRELAVDAARTVAAWIWEHREEFKNVFSSPEEAIAKALLVDGSPVVINDLADNPDGGAPGDATHLLKAMLDARLENATFGHIYDPEVARIAHVAGVGATINVALGGKHCGIAGPPVQVEAYVKTLTDGRFTLRAMFDGLEMDLGPMARLQVGGIDILVSSRRSQTFDPGVFELHGIDVMRCKIVALKSSNHFRAGFEAIAAAIIPADSPGISTTSQHQFLPRVHTIRPIWPLDEGARYQPRLAGHRQRAT